MCILRDLSRVNTYEKRILTDVAKVNWCSLCGIRGEHFHMQHPVNDVEVATKVII